MSFMPNHPPLDLKPFLPTSAPLADTYSDGRVDLAYTPYLYDAKDRRYGDDRASLMIGSAGCDGIEFALRRGYPGVWLFYPYETRWEKVADDIPAFESAWLTNEITI